jgi:hypothetical protein
MGDLREREGLLEDWAAVEMLRDSLGLTERDASILIVNCVWWEGKSVLFAVINQIDVNGGRCSWSTRTMRTGRGMVFLSVTRKARKIDGVMIE